MYNSYIKIFSGTEKPNAKEKINKISLKKRGAKIDNLNYFKDVSLIKNYNKQIKEKRSINRRK